VRTTISIPDDLLKQADRLVAEGCARNRNDLLVEALRQDIRRREREAIDAAFYAAMNDPELMAEEEQIMKEFEGADREAWAMIDEEYGPYDEDAE
jgi:metal-responsive CopG/Arc/MetJ family transcriptional regulator